MQIELHETNDGSGFITATYPSIYTRVTKMATRIISTMFARKSNKKYSSHIFLSSDWLDFEEEIITTFRLCLTIFAHVDLLNKPSVTSKKILKSNSGGVTICRIRIQYAILFGQKYTPPYCFFCNFAGWIETLSIQLKLASIWQHHLYFQGTKAFFFSRPS